MISTLLLDHYSVKGARRALLVTSLVTILIPSLLISGGGLNFFGLVLEVRSETLLTTARLVSLYFLWMFSWLLLGSAARTGHERVDELISRLVHQHSENARKIDNDLSSDNNEQQDLDPWWLHFHKNRNRLELYRSVFGSVTALIQTLALLSVEYIPPFLAGCLAVYNPRYANDLVFSTF